MVDPDLNARSTSPSVVLADGDDASGMAIMIADLLGDNLRDYPGRARVAARTRGSVVLTAADRDLSITLTFSRSGVEVANGARPGAPAMAGPWLAMSRVCSGRVSPLRAIAERELKVTPGRSLWALPAVGWVLSVPASFYEEPGSPAALARQQRRRRTAMVISTLLVVVMVVVIRRRRLRST